MKILAVIPARGGSKGIPQKNIVKLKGKPLMYYTIKASQNSYLINRTVVSTDDENIAKIAKKYNSDVIKRPKKLATASAQIDPVIEHVLSHLKQHEDYVPDYIVLLQNTAPLRTSYHVDNALRIFLSKKYDSLLSGFNSHKFLWKKLKNKSVPINYDPRKRPNRQNMKDNFFENGAIYMTKYTSFMKSKCRLSGRIGFYIMPEELSIEIDSMYDLFLVKQIMERENEK